MNKNKTIKRGGKVIGSGGFGCVLKPPIHCKNVLDSIKTKGSKKGITKLMLKKYAKEEFNEVIKYSSLLKSIPNYNSYFLIEGFELCKPCRLQKEDLKQFNEKCDALHSSGINEHTVNHSLNKLLAINMPYGGIDVGEYIDRGKRDLVTLNHTLIDLLENGILPMNNENVYHGDIKSSNILVQDEENGMKTRLIDWGLSTVYYEKELVPKIMRNRPFQYNIPFSNILFTDLFQKMYKDFLKETELINNETIRIFTINYVLEWVEKRGPGHLKTINAIFDELFKNELKTNEEELKSGIIQYDFTFYYIFEYITKILIKYTKERKLDLIEYFSDVYMKNMDVWGFVSVYFSILEYLYNHFETFSLSQKRIIGKIKELIYILLEHSDTAIDINQIKSVLKDLDSFLPSINEGLLKERKYGKKKEFTEGTTVVNGGKGSVHHKKIVKTLKKMKRKYSKKIIY